LETLTFFSFFSFFSLTCNFIINAAMIASLSLSVHNKVMSKSEQSCRTKSEQTRTPARGKSKQTHTHLRADHLLPEPARPCPFSLASFCTTYILLKSRLNPVDKTGSSTTSIFNLLTSLSNAS
jgi:hypothetical protein